MAVPALAFSNVAINENGQAVWRNGKLISTPGVLSAYRRNDAVVFTVRIAAHQSPSPSLPPCETHFRTRECRWPAARTSLSASAAARRRC